MTVEDVDRILDAARLPERVVDLCLRGDLQAQYDQAQRYLADQQGHGSLAAPAGVRSSRLEEIRQQMAAGTIQIRLRALPRGEFTALVGDHPPRDDHPGDRTLGVNELTMLPALVRRSIVDPVMTDDRWGRLVEVITDRQWDSLAWGAWQLNRGEVTIPLPSAA